MCEFSTRTCQHGLAGAWVMITWCSEEHKVCLLYVLTTGKQDRSTEMNSIQRRKMNIQSAHKHVRWHNENPYQHGGCCIVCVQPRDMPCKRFISRNSLYAVFETFEASQDCDIRDTLKPAAIPQTHQRHTRNVSMYRRQDCFTGRLTDGTNETSC